MNDDNLIPMSERDPDQVKAITTAGGVASGKARREKRKTLDLLELALSGKIKTKKGDVLTREQAYILSVIKRGCKTGAVDLLELIAKLRGELVNKADVEVSANIPAVLTDDLIITNDQSDNTPPEQSGDQ